MTRDQARGVVEWMLKPSFEICDDELHERWFNAALVNLSLSEAMDVARKVVARDDSPTPALFNRVRSELRQIAVEAAKAPTDGVAFQTPSFAKSELLKARQKLGVDT